MLAIVCLMLRPGDVLFYIRLGVMRHYLRLLISIAAEFRDKFLEVVGVLNNHNFGEVRK